MFDLDEKLHSRRVLLQALDSTGVWRTLSSSNPGDFAISQGLNDLARRRPYSSLRAVDERGELLRIQPPIIITTRPDAKLGRP